LTSTKKIDKINGVVVSMNDGMIEKVQNIQDSELQKILGTIRNEILSHSKGDNNKKSKYDRSSILSEIRTEFSDKFSYISSIIWLSNDMISKIISILMLDFHRHNRFAGRKLVRILNLFRKNRYFSIFPENPLYKRVKNQNSLQFLKSIMPIFTDLHEF